MQFFDSWHVLNERLNASDLTASTQLVMYKLFYMFDMQRFPESLLVSDRELSRITAVQSTSTIVNARRQLKSIGLLDFVTRRGRATEYRLGNAFGEAIEHLPNTDRTLTEHLPNTSQNSNIRARTPLAPVAFDEEEEDRARVLKIWQSGTGETLNPANIEVLTGLLREFGEDKLRAAIDRAVTYEARAKLPYVTAVLKGQGTRDKGEVEPAPLERDKGQGTRDKRSPDPQNTYPLSLNTYPLTLTPQKGGDTREVTDNPRRVGSPNRRNDGRPGRTPDTAADDPYNYGSAEKPDTGWIYAVCNEGESAQPQPAAESSDDIIRAIAESIVDTLPENRNERRESSYDAAINATVEAFFNESYPQPTCDDDEPVIDDEPVTADEPVTDESAVIADEPAVTADEPAVTDDEFTVTADKFTVADSSVVVTGGRFDGRNCRASPPRTRRV